MTNPTELERAKARIRALAAKTVQNGCTDAEAFAAAEMIGRLLDRYMLTMDEVELRTSPCVQISVPMAGRRRGPMDGCVPAIARFCHCIVWLEEAADEPPSPAPRQPSQPHKRYTYFGFEADVAMATYLHQVITQAIMTETQAFKHSPRGLTGLRLRRATRSFQHGMATRLADRLDALHQERETALRAGAAQGTALILAKQTTVAAAFAERKIRLATRGGRPIAIDRKAYSTGQGAGDRINLRRPLTEDPLPRLPRSR